MNEETKILEKIEGLKAFQDRLQSLHRHINEEFEKYMITYSLCNFRRGFEDAEEGIASQIRLLRIKLCELRGE
jgi:hypothetical protein